MTKEQRALAKQDMRQYLAYNPEANLTELAEYAANEQSHDEWLDDPDHLIWHIAFSISETYNSDFSSRDEYLEETCDCPDGAWKIRIAADLLGPEEDFDGLLSVLQDKGLDL